MELWRTVAEAIGCTRVAQKCAAVSADQFRSPNINLLLGSDACVEHTDNGIRSVSSLMCTLWSSGEFVAHPVSFLSVYLYCTAAIAVSLG